MKKLSIFISIMLIQFYFMSFLFADNYHPVPKKEMEMPKMNQPSVKELNEISEDLNPNKDMGYTGKESKEIAPVESKKLNVVEPIYSYQVPFKNIYSQTADCKILRYSYENKKWETVFSGFGKKGYEPYKIIVSPDEKNIGIVLMPDGKKGFYIKLLDIENRKLKDVGDFNGIGWYFFKKDSSSFVIVEQYTGKVTEIILND